MPQPQHEAPERKSPEIPRIDFTPEKFDEELDLVSETAWLNAKKLPEHEQLPKYFQNLQKMRTRYLEVADAQQEPEEHKAAAQALLGAFILSQHALYGGLDEKGKTGIARKFEENIIIQSSAAAYLGELNEKYKNNPAEATQRASRFWAAQERCLRVYFERNPKFAFDAWKNGILRDAALQWIIRKECKWDVVPQEDLRADAVQKVDLVALSSNDIAYLFQIKPMESGEQGGWEMDQVLPARGDAYGYSNEVISGMHRFADDNGLEDSTTKGFLIRVSASGEYINKQTGMPSPQFAQQLKGELVGIDGASRQKSAA